MIQRINFEQRQVNYYIHVSARPKDEWTCIKKSYPLPDLRGEFDLDLLTLDSLPVLLSAVCSSFLSVFFLSDFWSFFLCFLLLSVTDCEESKKQHGCKALKKYPRGQKFHSSTCYKE